MTTHVTPDAERLRELVTWRMPFGRYEGRILIDLPQAYLVWFNHQGWPRGKLGEAMALALEVKHNGLEHLLEPLRKRS